MQRAILALALAVATGGAAFAGEASPAPQASILFTKPEPRLPEGEPYLFLERGASCDSYRQYWAKGGTQDVSGTVRTRLIRELRDRGFKTDPPAGSGFNGGPERVFELSGVVRRITEQPEPVHSDQGCAGLPGPRPDRS